MEPKQTIISQNTLVPIGAFILLAGVCWSYGAMWQKVESMSEDVVALKQDVRALNSKIDTLIGRETFTLNQ